MASSALFVLKKFISLFVYPLTASILLILFGLILLIRNKRRVPGLIFVCLGLIILVAPSLPVVERKLTLSLEEKAGSYCDAGQLTKAGVRYIVALAGSSATPAGTPADKWGCSVLRELEGIRLKLAMPDARLVFQLAAAPN